MLVATARTATASWERNSDFMPRSPARSLAGCEIAFGIRQDHIPHGLVVFDVAGAAADMAIERFSDGVFEIGALHGRLGQALQQNLPFIEEARGAVAALEREMLDEGFLQRRQFVALRMSFDGADGLAVKACRRGDAGRAGVAGAIGIIDDHGATQALRGAAAELGAGHAEIFAQEIVHRELVAYVNRSVRPAVDREVQSGHAKTPLSRLVVTGRDRNRRPVASKIAFRMAGTTGTVTTSAMPFGGSSGVSGGSISISRSCSGRSDPRATRYCPRFHCPLPGPLSKGGSVSSK